MSRRLRKSIIHWFVSHRVFRISYVEAIIVKEWMIRVDFQINTASVMMLSYDNGHQVKGEKW